MTCPCNGAGAYGDKNASVTVCGCRVPPPRMMFGGPVTTAPPTDPSVLRVLIEAAQADARWWRDAGDERKAFVYEEDARYLLRALRRHEESTGQPEGASPMKAPEVP